MIRVLFIHHVGQLGGASTSLLELISSFPAGMVRPLVICPSGSAQDAFKERGIPVRTCNEISRFVSSAGLPLRGIHLLKLGRAIWAMRRGSVITDAIKEFQPHIVHLNERGLHHAAWLAKRAGVSVVMHARNVADRDSTIIHRLSIGLMRRNVDMTIAIDGSVANSLRELVKQITIYNPGRRETGPEFGGASSARTGKIRVLFLSILVPYKGLWEFIEAASLLRARRDIEFVIAGGNSRSPEFLGSWQGRLCRSLGLAADIESQLKERVREMGLEERVACLGFVKDVKGLLATCDVFAFPSHLNGPSRGVFEAGLLGIPSIVALRDPVEDVIKDGWNGLVIPDRDPRALADAIVRLADDPALRKRLGKRAREQFLTQFDPDVSGERVLKVYEAILSQKGEDYLKRPKANVRL